MSAFDRIGFLIPGNFEEDDPLAVQPVAKGLTDRLWYGGGSLKSAEWAEWQGWNLLTGNIVTGEGTGDFWTVQANLIHRFRTHWTSTCPPRVALGRVILPTDSADPATRQRYRDFAAARHARTLAPQGERRSLFTPDLVGNAEEIFTRLHADPIHSLATEFRLELPYEFPRDD